MENPQFEVTATNRIKQVAKRASYEREDVYRILDSSWVGIVAFETDRVPFAIPILFARKGDQLLFHGSTKSRLMNVLASGQSICMTVMHMDGMVLAKSLFHHSMNYRSATVFGTGKLVVDDDERMEALKLISDKVMPGRWEDARLPSTQEMKATSVVSVQMESASTKVRTGEPKDDAADLELPVWSGVVPVRTTVGNAETALESTGIATPAYVEEWIKSFDAEA